MTSRLRVNTIQSSAGLSTITVGASSVSFGDIEASKITASTGILFGTDTAAANTLDDYEEGTWTPSIEGSSTAGTYTGTFEGTYTKIGNQVTLRWTLSFITESVAGSGNILILGIPFTLTGNDCYGTLQPSNYNFNDTGSWVACRIADGSPTAITVRVLRDNNSALGGNVSDINSGSTNLNGQITYFTDA